MKQFFNKALFRLRKFLATNTFELARNLNEPILKKEIEENPPILSMAPKVLLEEKELRLIKPYLSHLKKAMLDKDILNIAITGNYGSGKSTVIKTFQHLNPQFKYLNISLASFQSNSTDEELEKKLEISILQQIFYHVDPSKIPDSKFKRIKTYDWGKLGLIALWFILWIYSAYAIINFDHLRWLNPINWEFNHQFEWFPIIFYLIFVLGIFIITKDIIRIVTNSKINKVNIKGELEIGEKNKKSVFNEHLEEILYFFEKTNYTTVVIEDLDRFKNTHIFTKLREINTLLNNFDAIKNKRKIKFIYAIKDELLKDKTLRVKFFDIIVPIIPFINQSNASEQLTKLTQIHDLENVLSTELINDVISLINDIDMRLLINIFLEYNVFRESLRPELPQDSLFSLIMYKNLYPKDFAKLYKNKGSLFTLVNNKKIYHSKIKEKIEKEIILIKEDIEKINHETVSDSYELRSIYLTKIIETIPNINSIFIKEEIPFHDFVKEDNFNQLVDSNKLACNILYYSGGYRKERRELNFSVIESNIDSVLRYKDRLQLIEQKQNNVLEKLRKKLNELNSELNEIESYSLEKIFQYLSIDENTSGPSADPIVKYLILNGYIDENYKNFISLFHNVNLAEVDVIFFNNLLTGGDLPFDYKLDKIDNLIKKINKKYFNRHSILNDEVLDLLITGPDYLEQKLLLFKYLSSEDDKVIKFIHSYIKRDKNISVFIKNICEAWEGFWNNVVSMDVSRETKDLYLRYIIEYGDVKDVIRFNTGSNSLIEYIQHSKNFFDLICHIKNKNKVKNLINELDFKFFNLQKLSTDNKWIFNYVYDNNLYRINFYNINILLNREIPSESIYTTILNSDLLHLIQYIKLNINDFVKHVLLVQNNSLKESVVAYLDLLNDLNLNLLLKFEIIDRAHFQIEQLSDIFIPEIKQYLMQKLKVLPNWLNVFNYYDSLDLEEAFDETLINFLNSEEVFNNLKDIKIGNINGKNENDISNFKLLLIHTSDLNIQAFKSIIKSIPDKYQWLHFSKLTDEKISFVIETHFIVFTVKGFEDLSMSNPDLIVKYIEFNQNRFLDNFSEIVVDPKIISELLESDNFVFKNKFELIKLLDQNILIEDSKIASRSCDILASSEYYPLSYAQLEFMFKYNPNWESKIEMLITHFKTLNFDQIQSLSKRLTPDGYYSKLFQKRNKPTFDKNAFNEAFFELLKSKSFIKSFDVSPWNKNEYRVIANY